MINRSSGPAPSLRRAASARPRALVSAAVLTASLSTCWTVANAAVKSGAVAKSAAVAKRIAVKSTAAKISAKSGIQSPVNLKDLPAAVEAYAKNKALNAAALSSASHSNGAVVAPQAAAPVGERGFGLIEVDLTKNTPSDEREPAFSPGGDFIAFASNGADTNSDGKIDAVSSNGRYHIWIMNRDGSNQRKISGLNSLDNERDQRAPSWSPDNQLVYTDRGIYPNDKRPDNPNLPDVGPKTELHVIRAPLSGSSPTTERRTFSGGNKFRPTWGPDGQAIAFATDTNPRRNAATNVYDTLPSYDIFTIAPSGSEGSVTRLTGGSGDAAGDTASDLNPAFSLTEASVIYFSSTRTNADNAGANIQRRIWLMSIDGSNKRQVSDPSRRPGFVGGDVIEDDFPAPSVDTGTFTERVAFQSNSRTDASDTNLDVNIWSLDIDSNQYRPRPPVPNAALTVAWYSSNVIRDYRPPGTATEGDFIRSFDLGQLNNPEDVIYTTDFTDDGYPDLLVSNRNGSVSGRIDLYNGATGQFIRIFAQGGGLTVPTGMYIKGSYLYVASGSGTTSTKNVKRFNLFSGTFADDFTASGAGGIANGIEGITFGPDANNNGTQDLYVTALAENKIVVFEGGNGSIGSGGAVIGDYITAGSGASALLAPTDIEFRGNTAFVSSSGNDRINRYTHTPAADPAFATGTFVDSFVLDNDGATYGLNAPERFTFGPDGNLYVSSFNAVGAGGATSGLGRRVLRFDGTTPNTPLPATGETGADYVVESTVSGPSGLVFNPTAFGFVPPALPAVVETGSNYAELETNPLSSANRAAAGQLAEDTAADREATFSRATASPLLTAQLAFASTRRLRPAPGSDPSAPSQPADNPFGEGSGSPTHDIWTSASEDFTPPTILPQGIGNVQYPVIAPGPQALSANLNAPRTFQEGLRANGNVTIALVIRDVESGLRRVTVSVKDAEQPTFYTQVEKINDGIPFRVAIEQQPRVVRTQNLAFYDNGPISAGGNERQANAIKGDGIYYCEGTFTTPGNASDYYFDVTVFDRAQKFNTDPVTHEFDPTPGNRFTYDNLWGFSTRGFARSSATSNLFVSDYTVGQNFPSELSGGQDDRFRNMTPIESYYLTNPGGDTQVTNGAGFIDPGTDRTTLPDVDVWRILSRGEVPQDVLDSYAARPVEQLDINDFKNGIPSSFPNTPKNRTVAAADAVIFWASPYTGAVFAGPGTLADAETQRRLTNFLEAGGRLFVSGRDVAYALSNGGTAANSFLRDELQASFLSETSAYNPLNVIDAVVGGRLTDIELRGAPFTVAFNDLQMPPRTGPPDQSKIDNTYGDAARNQTTYTSSLTLFDNVQQRYIRYRGLDSITPGTAYPGGTYFIDAIGPGSNSNSTARAYTSNGQTVGQRIERTRTNGFISRAVFLSFGLEGVNRRGVKDSAGVVRAANVRSSVADGAVFYMKTVTLEGTVTLPNTSPAANFLIQAVGPGGTYLAATNAQGQYSLTGLPSGSYTVRPALRPNSTRLLNEGFFNTDPVGITIPGGFTGTVNFTVVPSSPGSISGTVVSSGGTPDITSDDTPLANVPVLIKSIRQLDISRFPSGRFVALTSTDAGGRFTFANVPSNTDVIVIINPNNRLESDTTGGTPGDIPNNSGILYGPGNPLQPRIDVRRREIPDSRRPATVLPDGTRLTNVIQAPVSDSYYLNDLSADDTAQGRLDSGPSLLVPTNRGIRGRVLLNGQPKEGVKLELLRADLTSFSPPRIVTSSAPDSNGFNYTFFDVAQGDYKILASIDVGGYTVSNQQSLLDVNVPNQDATLPDVTAADINLTKQDITGIVRYNNQPLAGATVTLLGSDGATVIGSPPLASPNPVTTGSDGSYTFKRVDPGNYIVRATAPNGVTKDTPIVITVATDLALSIDLYASTISGTVRLNGTPISGVTVELLQNSVVVRSTTTAANGAYSFTLVPPGIYSVRASSNGDTVERSLTVPNGLDRPGIDLDLLTQTVAGTVTLNGVPAAGVTVQLFAVGQAQPQATTVSGTNGVYSFSNLLPGNYLIVAQQSGDRAERPVTIVRGNNLSGIDLELFLQTISGRITLNGNPLEGALVELISGGTVVQNTRSTTTGSYQFSNVVGGVYTVRATYLEDSASTEITVNRGAGGNRQGIDLELKLQTITGKVVLNRLDGKGPQPIGSAGVQLYRGTQLINATTTAANGTYSFTDVGPGLYTIRAGRFGDTGSITVNVTRGTNVIAPDIVLFLQNVSGLVTLNGKVLRSNGKDLKPAVVQFITPKGAGLARTVTDANGRYTFTGVPSGNFTIRVTYQGDSVERVVNVKRGQNLTAPTIELKSQVVAGTVTVNGVRTANIVVQLIQKSNGRVLQTTKTDRVGGYIFNNVIVGDYTVTASLQGDTASRDITIRRGLNGRVGVLALASQSITGTVTIDRKPAAGVAVLLVREGDNGEVGVARTTTDAEGRYTFAPVASGRYIVRIAPRALTQRDVNTVATRGRATVIPVVNFVSPVQPGPTPTPTPDPADDEFQPNGRIYQISVPYADSEAANATTTVAKAFTVPPTSGGTENYRISRYDALTQQYVQLSANSVIRRGEGYFLEPITRGTSIRRPAQDRTRKPMTAGSFELTLRTNPSRSAMDPTNGFNLIGFPFNPERFSVAEWGAAQVIVPDGRRFNTVREAAAAGVLSATLFNYDSDLGQYVPISDNLAPFKGYFARTFINGVKVILRPSASQP